MDLKCEEIWLKISNYIDGIVEPELRSAMDAHFAQCRRCKSVLDGMRNVVELYGNEDLIQPASDFQRGLHRWLSDRVQGPRGGYRGWAIVAGFVAALAACMALLAWHPDASPQPRAAMSQPASRITQELVAVVDSGKVFHHPSCPLIHGKYRMVTSGEAILEGYTPCVRCMKEDLDVADERIPQAPADNVHGMPAGDTAKLGDQEHPGDRSEVAPEYGAAQGPAKQN